MKNKLVRKISNYKLFTFLLICMSLIIGVTAWVKRPNSMRTPRYVVDKDYTDVVGSYDFTSEIETITYALNTKVKKTHYRLEQGYCYSFENVDMCINGYELFEINDRKNVSAGYRSVNSKNLMLVNMTIKNNRENVVKVKELGLGRDSNYNTIRAVTNDPDDMKIDNNIMVFDKGKHENAIIESGKEISGSLLFPLNDANFRQLYFDGGFIIQAPVVNDMNVFMDLNMFRIYSSLDLPVVPTLQEDNLKSINSIPTSISRHAKGYNTVINRYDTDITLSNEDGTVSARILRLEEGISTYKQSYYEKSYRSPNRSTNYGAVLIELTNNTSEIITTEPLMVTVGPKNKSDNQSASSVDTTSIKPGGTAQVVFGYYPYGSETVNYEPNTPLQFQIKTMNGQILIDSTFTIEK